MRQILHVDFNNFYASVECINRPELKNLPVAVGGDESARHGVVLAKNDVAKLQYKIKTGEPLFQARQRCPELIVLPPHMDTYVAFADRAREIYKEYTDQIESYGLDEAWLDVTGSGIMGSGKHIADEIRERIYSTLGITVSVGVSFNKVFAKLGSDMKKPNATTVISKADYREKIWDLDVGELLYVGRATREKFARIGINTIGDLANFDVEILSSLLGKPGVTLWNFANGYDLSPVAHMNDPGAVKSVGNSTTTYRDLVCDQDVKLVFYSLADSVANRLRKNGFAGRTIHIHVRDKDLLTFDRQCKLPSPSQLSGEIAQAAMTLFQYHYSWPKPVRSLGIQVSDLSGSGRAEQLDLFGEVRRRLKKEAAEQAVDRIRTRYGHDTLLRASMMTEPRLTGIQATESNFMHTRAITR